MPWFRSVDVWSLAFAAEDVVKYDIKGHKLFAVVEI